MILSYISRHIRFYLVRAVLYFIGLLVFLWILIHTLVTLSFAAELTFVEAFQNLSEAVRYIPFMSVFGCISTAIICLRLAVRDSNSLGRTSHSSAILCFTIFGVLYLLLPVTFLPRQFRGLSSSIDFSFSTWIGSRPPFYSFTNNSHATQIEEYEGPCKSTETIFSLPDRPNVVFLIIESMTSFHSEYFISEYLKMNTSTSKSDDLGPFLMPQFDSAMRDGVLWINMFANYRNTEGGLISIFAGTPPLQFPGSDWDMYENFSKIGRCKEKNPYYHTVFMASSSIEWRGEREFLKSRNLFDEILDQSNTPSFQQAKKFTFGAPSDKILYQTALEKIDDLKKRQRKPFQLYLENTSTHIPYIDPDGLEHNFQGVWRYADREFGRFYDSLKRNNFFDSGILVITGDHRRFSHISDGEKRLFGVTAPYRVPLAIIGTGFQPGKVDLRLISQASILSSFRKLADFHKKISEGVLLVPFWRKPIIGSGWSDLLFLYSDQSARISVCKGRHIGSKLKISERCSREQINEFNNIFHNRNYELQKAYTQR
jgi:hypothetical protein